MKAWASDAGKLARYEHIGWNEWPHRRGWAFQSGSIAIDGSSAGRPSDSCPSGSRDVPGDAWLSGAADPRREVRASVIRPTRLLGSTRPGRWAAEYSTAPFPSRGLGSGAGPSLAQAAGTFLQVDRAQQQEDEEDHEQQAEQARPARVIPAPTVAVAVADSAEEEEQHDEDDEE